MNLTEVRKTIDAIDAELLKLLHERVEYALRARKLKGYAADPDREKAVIENVKRQARGLLHPEFAEALYQSILHESKRIQESAPSLAGFQGEHGAYGEMAVGKFSPALVPIPCREFGDVFEGVRQGELDLGVVPVENSLEGSVTEVNDILVAAELKIVGEATVPIHYCLLSLPDTDHREIKAVYSHPQALAQCRAFIARNRLEPRPFYDTAGSAKWLADERPKGAGAIASPLAAEHYHLEVIKENVEDHPSNVTRFVVLSREASREPGNKCSIGFSTRHRAGALFDVLKVFARAGINLTRIASQPVRSNPGTYAFFLDFQGSDQEHRVKQALEEVKRQTVQFNFWGCYREAEP